MMKEEHHVGGGLKVKPNLSWEPSRIFMVSPVHAGPDHVNVSIINKIEYKENIVRMVVLRYT